MSVGVLEKVNKRPKSYHVTPSNPVPVCMIRLARGLAGLPLSREYGSGLVHRLYDLVALETFFSAFGPEA